MHSKYYMIIYITRAVTLLNVQSYYYTARAVILLYCTCSHITISHVQSYRYITRAMIFLYRDVISLTFLVTLTLIRITEHVTPGLTRHLLTSNRDYVKGHLHTAEFYAPVMNDIARVKVSLELIGTDQCEINQHTRSIYSHQHTRSNIPAPTYPLQHTRSNIPAPTYPLQHTRSNTPTPR